MIRYVHLAFIVVLAFVYPSGAEAQKIIITVAGNGAEGYHGDSGKALNCEIHWPEAVALDDSNNFYIADADNNVIRKVYGATGKIATIVGTGFEAGDGLGGFGGDGGPATAAQLSYPSGIAVEPLGNIFIVDQRNNRIRKVDNTGNINTIAGSGFQGYSGDGGAATNAALYHPTRVTLDATGNLYIADSGNNRIRKVDATGTITTIAGNGTQGSTGDGEPAISAELFDPMDMAVDGSGNVYIADYVNNRIRKVDGSGNMSTFAGIGIAGWAGDSAAATNANIYEPSGIVIDAAGNIYFSDLANGRVRKVDPTGMITTYVGDGRPTFGGDNGPATDASLWFPEGLAIDARGQLYIADKANNRIRLVTSVLSVNNVNTSAAIKLYPNPNNGDFALRISSDIDEQVHVIIANVTGQKIKELITATNETTRINVDAPPGVYFLNATTANSVLNEKVVVR